MFGHLISFWIIFQFSNHFWTSFLLIPPLFLDGGQIFDKFVVILITFGTLSHFFTIFKLLFCHVFLFFCWVSIFFKKIMTTLVSAWTYLCRPTCTVLVLALSEILTDFWGYLTNFWSFDHFLNDLSILWPLFKLPFAIFPFIILSESRQFLTNLWRLLY